LSVFADRLLHAGSMGCKNRPTPFPEQSVRYV